MVAEILQEDLDKTMDGLMRCELPSAADAVSLCLKAEEVLRKERNVCHVASPVSVVGVIHVAFDDVLVASGHCITGAAPPTNALQGSSS